MRFHPFHTIILFLSICFVSCGFGDNNNDIEISNPDNADFASLKFTKNDSIPYLETAVFTVEESDSDDPVFADLEEMIVNLDSLPYQTRIDSVFPTFTFESTRGAYLTFYVDSLALFADTTIISGSDTIDFSRRVKLHNTSYDGTVEKEYLIKVNVHTVEPELYHWNKLSNNLSAEPAFSQNTVLIGDSFYFYSNNTVNNFLRVSDDGANWTSKSVTGLPPYVSFKNLELFNNKLFLLDENNTIYVSEDYVNWSQNHHFTDMDVLSFLFVLNDKLWAVVKKGGVYKFAFTADGSEWTLGENIPQNFPVKDFAAMKFLTILNVEKAVVVGGMLPDGEITDKIWTTENSAYWLPMPTSNLIGKIKGGKLGFYDKKLHLFGGMDEDSRLREEQYYISSDEGFTWQLPDTTYNKYKELVLPRAFESVLVKDKELYIVGGQNQNSYLYDVWKGSLNRLQFDRQ